MGRWDTGAPNKCGLDLFAVNSGLTLLDSAAKAAAQSIQLQAAVANILSVSIHPGTIPTRGGLYEVSTYSSENAVASAHTTLTAVPNADVSGAGTGAGQWQTNAGSAASIFAAVDELPASTTDWIQSIVAPGFPGTYVFRWAIPSLTGKRIHGVTMNMLLGSFASCSITYGLRIGGVFYPGGTQSPGGAQAFSKTWATNPATLKPWTIADVTALGSTDAGYITGSTSASVGMPLGYGFSLDIDASTENRLSTGTADDSASALTEDAWNVVPQLTPTGGVPSKPGSGYLLVVIARVNDIGSMNLTWIDLPSGSTPRTDARSFLPTRDPAAGLITAMGSTQSKLYGALITTTGPVVNADSQPYVSIIEAPISSGVVAKQEFSDASAQTYSPIQGRIKPNSAAQDLTGRIKTVAGDVQKGGDATLTAADALLLPDLGNGWRALNFRLASVGTLAAAVQYYVELSSIEAASTWSALVLGTDGAGQAASFGGTTDAATEAGARSASLDMPITVGAAALDPVAPTGFTATVMQRTVDPTALCEVDTVDFVRLSWTPTAAWASPAYYQIQRSTDAGVTWEEVGRVLTYTISTRDVLETGAGLARSYRIRTVNSDGVPSNWSSTATATTAALGFVVEFCSDMDPSLTVAYDYEPTVNYTPGDRGVVIPTDGADYGLGFQPGELPAPVLRLSLKLSAPDRPPPGGGFGYDALLPLRNLRAAQGDTIPHVCVLDKYGREWRGLLRLPNDLVLVNPGERYTIQVELWHLQDTPFVLETQMVAA